jgi:hypothetical protein
MRYLVRRIKLAWCASLLVVLAGFIAGCGQWTTGQWYRGNTHTHTWWSDGDSAPEMVVKWYKDHGYHFLVLSDHNALSQGEKWVAADKKRGEGARLYEQTFGSAHVVKRKAADGQEEYLCTPLDKVKAQFEEPGRFLLVQGEEISDSAEGKPVHLNGVNLAKVVPAQHGASITDTLQNNLNAVFAQRAETGQAMLVHINHPNFGWGLRAEHLMMVQGPAAVEVANGHPGVNNRGDETYMSTERMWDVVLTRRLAQYDLPIMYGFATDDAHSFTGSNSKGAGPGRAWIMVRAKSLSAADLVDAMDRGDFYGSTGVTLRSVRFADNLLDIEIEPEQGVSYRTQFIGTLEGYDDSVASLPSDPKRGPTCRYSDDVGRVLSEQAGCKASYRLTGREIYVRAKVISTAKHAYPVVAGELQAAWLQPVRAAGRAIGVR